MGDITNVNELSIDPGCTYDPDNDHMTVKNKISLYQAASLHTLTDQMAATDCLQMSVQVDGYPVGSPIVTGIGLNDYPGVNISGILASTNPADATPAIKLQGYKQSGAGVTALADAETIVQVVDNNNAGVKFFGNGEIATVPWTDYSAISTIDGWATFEAKEIFYKLVGRTCFCTYYLRGESNSTDVSFTLPWSGHSSYYILGFSQNMDVSTNYIGTIVNLNGIINVYRQFESAAFTASGTKDVRGNFWFEINEAV